MKAIILKKLILLLAIGLFPQFATAQNDSNGAALKLIADIVIGLNHFPSDDDLETLDQIIANGGLAQGIRAMANAVASIEHSANEESKGEMEALHSNAEGPEPARLLARIIDNFSHGASDDAKAQLAEMFP